MKRNGILTFAMTRLSVAAMDARSDGKVSVDGNKNSWCCLSIGLTWTLLLSGRRERRATYIGIEGSTVAHVVARRR